jgi:hypothetical protein
MSKLRIVMPAKAGIQFPHAAGGDKPRPYNGFPDKFPKNLHHK